MKKLVFKIMEIFPVIEVIIRYIYWNFKDSFLLDGKKKKVKKKRKKYVNQEVCLKDIMKRVREYGIKKGDLLIVHSGMEELESHGIQPHELLESLLELIGEEGTLVLPAFPVFKEKDILSDKDGQIIYSYNVKKAISSTGILPNLLCRMKGTVRSPFPHNTLAAYGPLAEAMMKDNLKGDLPHGKESAWDYCTRHRAKILYLGLQAYNRSTILHVVEDTLDEDWPVREWYEEKKYKVIQGIKEEEVTIRVARLFYARFITEHYTAKLLRRENLLREEVFQGIHIGFMKDASETVKFCKKRALQGKLGYRIPKKYLKNIR